MWFNGDSALALFKLEDEETTSVLLRAISCGMQLSDSLQNRELQHGPKRKLRVIVTIAGSDKEQSKEQTNIFCGYMGGVLQR